MLPRFIFVGHLGEPICFGFVFLELFLHRGVEVGCVDIGGVVIEDDNFVDAEYGGCAGNTAGKGGFGIVGSDTRYIKLVRICNS